MSRPKSTKKREKALETRRKRFESLPANKKHTGLKAPGSLSGRK